MGLDFGHETERLAKYHKCGFCPIDLGDRIAGRFIVLHKLGFGGFGTVWLVRDEDGRHGRYVALKVVSASFSDEYESPAVVQQLRDYERDKGYPGLFLLELERLFHISINGRHLCQIFPVLGPTLSSLNTGYYWLYAAFVKPFAHQIAAALDIMHSRGICHGDLTLNNVAVRLTKSLDALTEKQLDDIFGEPRRQFVDQLFRDQPSCGPQFAVAAVNLSRLPAEYFSTRLCILDFDQAFFMNSPPRGLSHVPPAYLAPESIFSLINGSEADVWAFGSILFSLRRPTKLFWDFISSGPLGTAKRMYETLGPMPQEWYTYPFLDGYPVHVPLQPDAEDRTLEFTHMGELRLEKLVSEIFEPHRLANSPAPRTGVDKFGVRVAELDMDDHEGETAFKAKHTTPIQKQDADLFCNLLRQIFTYDHRNRITAKQVLEHPWLMEPGQKPCFARPESGV